MKKSVIIPAIIAVIAATASVFTMTACNTSVAKTATKIAAGPVKRAVKELTQKVTTAPTTAAPTTVAPTTVAPTTVAPTTAAPTTAPAMQAPTEAPKKAPVQEKKEKPAQTDAEKVYAAAKEAVAKCTNDGMTKEQKLRAAFDYLKNNYMEGIRRSDYREMDWPVVYGTDMLINGKGDCFSYGASFAYMAKAIGCSDCYACNSGGHGWAEVEGKIYDPEWSRHSTNYSYFGMSYDEPCDVPYKGALGSAAWMHVAV